MPFLTLRPGARLISMPNTSLIVNDAISSTNSQRMLLASAGGSVCAIVLEHSQRRERKNLEVEQRRPALEVFEVVVQASLHVFETHRLAAAAVHLGEARDARRCLVTDHVALDEAAIFFVVS